MDDARAGSLSAPVRPEAAALACVPHVEYDDALAHVEAVSYTHLTLPTKRIV